MDHFFTIKTLSTLILNKIAPQIKISWNQKQYELNPKLQQITIEPFTKNLLPQKKNLYVWLCLQDGTGWTNEIKVLISYNQI